MMSPEADPRILFAAERTVLAWQRSSVALMGFGFVIERFSLFLAALQHTPTDSSHHLFSALMGVLLILLGAGVALGSGLTYRRFVRTLPPSAVPNGYPLRFASLISVGIAAAGLALAAYLLTTTIQSL